MKKLPIPLSQHHHLLIILNPPAMPIAPRLICISFLAVFSLSLFSCKKDPPTPPTVINGKVTDKKSGLPIEGADIYIEFYRKDKNGNKIITHSAFITDQNGEFFYTDDSFCDGIALSTVIKKEYNARAHIDIKCGQVNDLDIELVPKDGVLRLSLINVTGQHDSIWVILENPSRTSESHGLTSGGFFNKFPVILSQNESYIEFFNLTSEEFTKIYWGFENIMPKFKEAPFRDSVYLILKDTTEYTLSF